MIRSFKDLEVYQISVDLYPRIVKVSCNEAVAHLEMAVKSGFISKKLFDELHEQFEILGKKIYTLRKNWK